MKQHLKLNIINTYIIFSHFTKQFVCSSPGFPVVILHGFNSSVISNISLTDKILTFINTGNMLYLFLSLTRANINLYEENLCRDRMVVGFQLPVQSFPITTKVVSSNTANGEVYFIQVCY